MNYKDTNDKSQKWANKKNYDNPNNIRNISVIAHYLTDSIIATGVISLDKIEDERFIYNKADDTERYKINRCPTLLWIWYLRYLEVAFDLRVTFTTLVVVD